MSDLIAALQILLKYEDRAWPTNCSHDELTVVMTDPNLVSEEDVAELDRLGFIKDDYGFTSFRFGSC